MYGILFARKSPKQVVKNSLGCVNWAKNFPESALY